MENLRRTRRKRFLEVNEVGQGMLNVNQTELKWLKQLTAFLLTLSGSISLATPLDLTYQGRIVNPSGVPLDSQNVQFTVKIVSPGIEACTLYEELHTLNFQNSDGLFSIRVGAGTRTTDDPGLSLDRVFTNTGVRSGLSHCAPGYSSYTPVGTHSRRMYVSFNDGGGVVSFGTPYEIRAVPYALETRAIAGFTAENLCRVADESGNPQIVSALTPANFAELLNLIDGTSNLYSKTSTTQGTQLSVLNSSPSTPTTGSIWLDASSSALRFYDGSNIRTLGTSGGSLTSITAGTGLTGGTITTSGTINVDVGTTANKIVQLNGSAELPAVSGANLTSLNASNITSGTIAAARLPSSGVAASTYRSVTVDSTGRVTSGTNPTTIAEYGLTDAVRNGGQTGALVIGPSDANSLTFNTDGTARLWVNSAGNVGIGTSIPSRRLHVSGGQVLLSGPNSTLLSSAERIGSHCPGGVCLRTDTVSIGTITIDHDGADGSNNSLLRRSVNNLRIRPADHVTLKGSVIFERHSDSAALVIGQTQGAPSYFSSQVGIGTTTPAARLDVAGNIKIGFQAADCTSTITGTLRYNSGTLEYCDGSKWANLATGSTAMSSINGLTAPAQILATPGTSGTAPNWSSADATHTLNIPMASTSGVTAGLISKTDYDSFNGKQNALGYTPVNRAGDTMTGALSLPSNGLAVGTSQFVVSGGNVGIGTTTPVGGMLSIVQGSSAALGSNAIAIGNSGAGLYGLRNESNNGLSIDTAFGGTWSSRVYISRNNGAIGFGTINPSNSLSFGPGASRDIGIERRSASGAGDALTIRAGGAFSTGTDLNGGTLFLSSGIATGSGSSQIQFQTSAAGSSGSADTLPSTKMTILGNGNVGIGSTNPQYILDIAGATRISNTLHIASQIRGYGGDLEVRTAGGDIRFTPVGSEAMRITTSGNIGIGTTAPATRLDVAGGVRVGSETGTCAVGLSGTIRLNGSTLEYCNGSAWSALATGSTAMSSLNGLTAASQSFATPGTTGTAPNWSSADATHTLNIPMASASGVTAGLISKTDYDSFNGKQNALGYTPVNRAGDTMTGALSLPSNGLAVGTSQLVVSGGNVGIGTASPTGILGIETNGNGSTGWVSYRNTSSGASAGPLFSFINNNSTAILRVGNTSSGSTASLGPSQNFIEATAGNLNIATSSPGSSSIIKFYTGGITASEERMRVTDTGRVGIGTTIPGTRLQVAGVISPSVDNTHSLGTASLRFTDVYAVSGVVNTSDARQKEDIKNSDLGLEFINKLRPVSYRWKTGDDTTTHYGLIAQETEKAIHQSNVEAGGPAPAGQGIVTYDSSSDRYGVRYTELLAPMIKAVQQLHGELKAALTDISILKSNDATKDKEISALKAENAAMKAYLCTKEPKAPFCN
jgi:trimeric autotransporter adhesin